MSGVYTVTDPTTGTRLCTLPTATDADVDRAVSAAGRAFATWRRRTPAERSGLLGRIAVLYRRERSRLAAIATREMGKTTREALGEIALVADIFDYYARNAPQMLRDRQIPVAHGTAVVQHGPIGVILGIMPWNYPYYQEARFAAPNLALGNTILFKPAPNCPASADAIAAIYDEAGLPGGVHTVIRATNAQVADVIARPEVQGVSFTGSERGGRQVAARAGACGKKVVLELGGSDPFIVLPDADIPAAADAAVFGRMQNAGQACSASKRFIVFDAVYDAFVDAFTRRVRALRVGDPMDEATDMGPLSSEQAAQSVMAQVDDAVDAGATVLAGGFRPDRPGAFVAPTVLANVPETARAYREEVFGPVAIVHRVSSVDDALRVANDTPFGLGSVVFGRDAAVMAHLSTQLEVGMVAVNGPSVTQADTPFGGVKASGFGRELGESGLFEFANRKLVRNAAEGSTGTSTLRSRPPRASGEAVGGGHIRPSRPAHAAGPHPGRP